ncbi:MAG: hypothetical protein ACO1OB_34880, partial [Archangium sp.]
MTTITRSLPTSTVLTSSTSTTAPKTVTTTAFTSRDEFVSGDAAALRAKVLGLFSSPKNIDFPSPGDLLGAGKSAFEKGKETLGAAKDTVEEGLETLSGGFDGIRESIGDEVLDRALGVNRERIDSLDVGDSLTIGADLEIEARLNGGIGGGVTLTRTADGEYTAKVGADILAGFDLKAFGLSSESAWGAEFTFSSPDWTDMSGGMDKIGYLTYVQFLQDFGRDRS